MFYKIGVLAEMFGVSPQTIRNYEEHGFLSPVRDDMSTTRRYQSRNIKWLFSIRRYLAMGFSIKDIWSLFSCETVEELDEKIKVKEKELEKEILKIQQQLEAVKRQEEDLTAIQEHVNQCGVIGSMEMYYVVNQKGQEIDESKETMSVVKNWLQHIEYVYSATIVNEEYIAHPEMNERDSGFCVEVGVAEQFHLLINENVTKFKYENVLHTITTLDDDGFDLTPVNEYCREHHLTVAGPGIGKGLSRIGEKQCASDSIKPKCIYYELFLPVKEICL